MDPNSPFVPTTEDGFRRRVSYLRVSLTDRCNLRCRYCMPKEGVVPFPKNTLLTTEEIKRLTTIFRELGVTKVRLTGGEPLLRTDLDEILSHVYGLGVEDVSMTTNGVLLENRLPDLLRAGLKRINISLDTFQPERFEKITGTNALARVLAGIRCSVEAGLEPVKINMVVMRGWNFDEVAAFVRFARENPVEVRFLELMPTRNTFEGTAMVDKESFVPVDEIRREVEKWTDLGAEDPVRGVARTHSINGGKGKIGFVSPVSNHFCGTCNRVRLTSTGGLKTCLHGADVVDLRGALRSGATNQDIAAMIRAALFLKPEEHFIRPDHYESRSLQMSRVGG